MSIDYCTEKKILMDDLFDGRLAPYGIVEAIAAPLTQEERTALEHQMKVGLRGEHMESFSRLRFEENRKLGHRCLTDGRNYLWCFPGTGDDLTPTEYLGEMTRNTGNDPTQILMAIQKVFDTEIFDEHQPQYWGFEDQKEMDAKDALNLRVYTRTCP